MKARPLFSAGACRRLEKRLSTNWFLLRSRDSLYKRQTQPAASGSIYEPQNGQHLVPATTQAIGLKGAQSIYYAVGEFADTIGLPLTHFVTIDFACTTIQPSAVPGEFQRLLTLMRKRLSRPARGAGDPVPATWAWVMENERNGRPIMTLSPNSHNLHAHIAIHLPANRVAEIRNFLRAHLTVFADPSKRNKVLRFAPVTRALGLRRYFLKGTTQRWARRFGVHSPKAQGLVPGPRSRTSRNLGPSARRATDRKLGIRRRRPKAEAGER